MKTQGLRRTLATAAVATMGIVGVTGGGIALAAPSGVSTWTSGGGTTGNARFTSGCCSIRVKVTCANTGAPQYGLWKNQGQTSSTSCGPQGFSGLNWQGVG